MSVVAAESTGLCSGESATTGERSVHKSRRVQQDTWQSTQCAQNHRIRARTPNETNHFSFYSLMETKRNEKEGRRSLEHLEEEEEEELSALGKKKKRI